MKDTRKVLSGQWIIVLNDGKSEHFLLTQTIWVSRKACQEEVAKWLDDEKFNNVEVTIRQRRQGDLPWLKEEAE
jgi:hypothetical protein